MKVIVSAYGPSLNSEASEVIEWLQTVPKNAAVETEENHWNGRPLLKAIWCEERP